jgi:hypothetical protein
METKASNRRGFFSRLAAVVTGGIGVQNLMARQPMAQGAPAPDASA